MTEHAELNWETGPVVEIVNDARANDFAIGIIEGASLYNVCFRLSHRQALALIPVLVAACNKYIECDLTGGQLKKGVPYFRLR